MKLEGHIDIGTMLVKETALNKAGFFRYQWQPIADAPKDGTFITVWVELNLCSYMVYWCDDMNTWLICGSNTALGHIPAQWTSMSKPTTE